MGAPAVTYSFSNGTTSDASQVNTNFTNLISAMSDGTVDFSVGSLVVAGATTLNGAVTLGNSTADAVTITGNISASLTFSANATHNIGTSTVAPLSLYLGNGTKSVRLLAGTVGTSWTFTFPNDVPAVTGQTMVFDTSGTASFRYPDKFTATKTANYTATGDETVILCDPTTGAASFTVTLPAASTMTGKELTIVKVDAGLTYTVTIDANSSETILPSVQSGNLTYILYTQYESVTLKCNGTSWYVVHHYAQTDWADFPSLAYGTLWTTTGTAAAYGTTATHKAQWRRSGREMLIKYIYRQTATGTAGTGALLFNLMSGATIDTSLVTVNTGVTMTAASIDSNIGNFYGQHTTSIAYSGVPVVYSSTQLKFFFAVGSSGGTASAGFLGGSGYADYASNAALAWSFNATLPITGWNP